MILKIKTGKGSRGVLNYISAGAGQAAPMFTNMAGQTPRELAREVAALRSLRPNLGKAAAHLILAHDPGQRPLTEAEWEEALEIALKEHGAEGARTTSMSGLHMRPVFRPMPSSLNWSGWPMTWGSRDGQRRVNCRKDLAILTSRRSN